MARARTVRQRRTALGDVWRTRLWPFPALGVLAAVCLGVGLPRIDMRIAGALPAGANPYLFSGGPGAARSVLSAVAGSLITVTSLTFSLTMVTLQLASSQYSPRILRTFTRDRLVHVSLAVLLAAFTYSLTVQRTIRTATGDQAAFVPQISVTVAYLLAVASVIVLVLFLAHLARQIRVDAMLRGVHAETVATIHRVLPAGPTVDVGTIPPVPAEGAVRLSVQSSGFLTFADEKVLLAATLAADAVVTLDPSPGDSLVAGTPIGMAWNLDQSVRLDGEALAALRNRVADAIQIGFERTTTQDVAYGFRQVIDIALRALSPGINDPTTAVHALGHAAALLCTAVRRDLGPRLLHDDAGRVRVVLRRPDFGMLLDLAVDQPSRYGAREPAVLARLLMLLREVAWSTDRPEHHRAVAEQFERLGTVISRQDFDRLARSRLDDLAHLVREAMAEVTGAARTRPPCRPR